MLGLTATATIKVKEDLVKQLKMKDVLYFVSSFNRPNLFFEIREKTSSKDSISDIAHMLSTQFRNQSGIVYCTTRKECEKLCEILNRTYKVETGFYHAELEAEDRKKVQDAWM